MLPAGLQARPLHRQPLLTAVGAVCCLNLQEASGQLGVTAVGTVGECNCLPGWTAVRLWLSCPMQSSMLSMSSLPGHPARHTA